MKGNMKKKPAVKTITIAKLYNTGNYEHVRYELSVEVPQGCSAKDTFLDVGSIIASLGPIKKPYDYDSSKARLSKLPEQLNESEKDLLKEDMARVGAYQACIDRRKEALDRLDNLGGKSKRGGGRDDNQDCPF